MADDDRPYTRDELRRAINLGAVLGWAGFVLPLLIGDLTQALGLLPWYAAIGLPISFFLSWAIGAPILWWQMRRPIGWLRAATLGGGLAAIFAAISIIIGRLNGLRRSRDDNSFSQYGGGDYIMELDGILTPYGWWVLAQNTLMFICLGIAVGVLIRAIIGPGRMLDVVPPT